MDQKASFQMYDDDVSSSLYNRAFYHPAPFPTRNISTPILLLYGTVDSLVDIDVMLSQLPEHTIAEGIEGHEHVDILWGKEVDKLVIPRVLECLKGVEAARKSRTRYLGVGNGIGTGTGTDGDARSEYGFASEEVDSDRQ